MFKCVRLIIFSAPLAYALATSFKAQAPQNIPVHHALNTTRQKVPGDNPAYFTRVDAYDQLFPVDEFSVSPYPPATAYGFIHDVYLPKRS